VTAADGSPDTALRVARALVAVLAAWVAIGVLVATAFVARGAARVDREAHGGTLGFKLLIFPACVALWPLLLFRWRRANGEAPREHNAHRDSASEAAR
jgi:hypothetical protein